MSTAASLSVECDVHVRLRSRKELATGPATSRPELPAGRVPRVARLMALALRLEGLVRTGAVRDYAELARLGHVTRARMSQVMSLLNLAPDLQEQILFLPPTLAGRDPLVLRQLLPIAAQPDWQRQRRQWRDLCCQHGVVAND
jgi:hypothetical protein